jgi:hypothetical protein
MPVAYLLLPDDGRFGSSDREYMNEDVESSAASVLKESRAESSISFEGVLFVT